MWAQAMPAIGSMIVVVAGALQFSTWKARHLACCREESQRSAIQPADAGAAWRQGLRLGFHCVNRCASLTAILLVLGVMDLHAMAAATAAISFERFAPSGERAAQTIGAIAIAVGALLMARAFGFA